MSTTVTLQTSANQTPAVPTGVLTVGQAAQSAPVATAETSVASTVAAVSSTVGEQIEIAQITASLRKKLVPLLPEFSLSTGINGADEVGEFARMVNDLNRIRNANLAEV